MSKSNKADLAYKHCDRLRLRSPMWRLAQLLQKEKATKCISYIYEALSAKEHGEAVYTAWHMNRLSSIAQQRQALQGIALQS
jgi:hypothetical protein